MADEEAEDDGKEEEQEEEDEKGEDVEEDEGGASVDAGAVEREGATKCVTGLRTAGLPYAFWRCGGRGVSNDWPPAFEEDDEDEDTSCDVDGEGVSCEISPIFLRQSGDTNVGSCSPDMSEMLRVACSPLLAKSIEGSVSTALNQRSNADLAANFSEAI